MRANITDPVMLIRLSRSYKPGMSAQALYDVTRGVWVVGIRREKARYALAVFQGIVREVYDIDQWHPACTTKYVARDSTKLRSEGRWEFTGRVAAPGVRERYVDRDVTGYFTKGAKNPIQYVNA